MPMFNNDILTGGLRRSESGWHKMSRWQRKKFHRNNENRVRQGLARLTKPSNWEPRTNRSWCGLL